jgi:hypothetical protein
MEAFDRELERVVPGKTNVSQVYSDRGPIG